MLIPLEHSLIHVWYMFSNGFPPLTYQKKKKKKGCIWDTKGHEQDTGRGTWGEKWETKSGRSSPILKVNLLLLLLVKIPPCFTVLIWSPSLRQKHKPKQLFPMIIKTTSHVPEKPFWLISTRKACEKWWLRLSLMAMTMTTRCRSRSKPQRSTKMFLVA